MRIRPYIGLTLATVLRELRGRLAPPAGQKKIGWQCHRRSGDGIFLADCEEQCIGAVWQLGRGTRCA